MLVDVAGGRNIASDTGVVRRSTTGQKMCMLCCSGAGFSFLVGLSSGYVSCLPDPSASNQWSECHFDALVEEPILE